MEENQDTGRGRNLATLILQDVSVGLKQPVFQAADGSLDFNRDFALLADGSILFNGNGGLWRYDARTKQLGQTKSSFPSGPGMRCSTLESKQGFIYGITHQTSQLF